jgi:hypothetical protein
MVRCDVFSGVIIMELPTAVLSEIFIIKLTAK